MTVNSIKLISSVVVVLVEVLYLLQPNGKNGKNHFTSQKHEAEDKVRKRAVPVCSIGLVPVKAKR